MIADAIEWLLTFTNETHRAWAFGSITLLFLAMATSRIARSDVPHVYLLGCHVCTVPAAIIYVTFGFEGDVYTVHCIWFNALMAATHLLLLRRFQRRRAHSE